MPLSSMTAFPFIPEGSEATPGLWNNPLSIISQNIAELNIKAIGLSSGLVLNGSGDPNSNITAGVGFIYEQIDSTASVHPLWVKKIGSGNTGWASDAGFMGDAGDGQGAIQVGQNASAQALNTLALGASSFVGPNANQGIAAGFGSTVTGSGAVGIGASAQVYSPNGVGVGVNAYVGFRDAGAFGSNVTSNATGAFTFGVGGINSRQSAMLFTTTAVTSSTSTGQCYFDFMQSTFSGRVEFGLAGRVWNSNTTTLSATSVAVGLKTFGAMFIVRDTDNGGSAMVTCDNTSGTAAISGAIGTTVMVAGTGPSATQIGWSYNTSTNFLTCTGGSSRSGTNIRFTQIDSMTA